MSNNAIRLQAPLENLKRAFDRNNLGLRQGMDVIRNSRRIVREHINMTQAHGQTLYDASGAAKVHLQVIRANTFGLKGFTLQARLAATAVHFMGRAMIKSGKNIQWAGRQVMVGLTIPIAMLGTAISRVGEEYNREMTRVVKVTNFVAEQGSEIFDVMVKDVEAQTMRIAELGASLGFVASESARVAAEFAQMGYQGAALDRLADAAMRLSRVSGTDLDDSITLTRLSAQAFGVELGDLTETFARLNMVENNTALSLRDMARSIPVVAGVAAGLNINIQETAALLAMMRENGIEANEAATALRTGLIRIVQEATDPAIKAFEQIGLDLVGMQERMKDAGGDVFVFFDELSDKLKAIDAAGEESGRQMLEFTAAIGKLAGTRQAARFLSFLKEIGDRHIEGSVAQRAFMGAMSDAQTSMEVYAFEQERIEQSAAGIADVLRAELNLELVKMSDTVLEIANSLRQLGVNVLRWFNALDGSTKRWIISTAALIAVLGPLTMTFGIMLNAMGQLVAVSTALFKWTGLMTPKMAAEQVAFGASAGAAKSKALQLNALRMETERYVVALESSTLAEQRNAAAMAGNLPFGATGARRGGMPAGAQRQVGSNLFLYPDGSLRNRSGAFANYRYREVSTPTGPRYQEIGGSGRFVSGDVARAEGFLPATGGAGGAAASRQMGLWQRITQSFSRSVTLFHAAVLAGAGRGMMGAGRVLPGRLGGAAAARGASTTARGAGIASGAGVGGGILKGVATALAAVGAKLTAILAIIAAIGAAIGGVIILADPRAFASAFMDQVRPAIERVKDAFDQIVNTVMTLWNSLTKISSASSEMGSVAASAGQVIGSIFASVVSIVAELLTFINGLIEGLGGVIQLFGALSAAISGDTVAATHLLQEAFKSFGRMAVDVVHSVLQAILSLGRTVASLFSFIPRVGSAARDFIGGVKDDLAVIADLVKEDLASSYKITDELKEHRDIARQIERAHSDISRSVREGQEYYENINGILKRNLGEEADLSKMTREQIMALGVIDDLQKERIIVYREEQKILNDINTIKQRIQQIDESAQDQATVNRRRALQEQLLALEEKRKNVAEDISFQLSSQHGVLNNMVDEASDFADELGGAADEAERGASAAREWSNALRSGISEVMGDIRQQVQNTLRKEQQELDDLFRKRLDDLADYYSEEARKIEENTEEKLRAIDEQEEREAELERVRQRWFENEKARIDFLRQAYVDNIDMQEALARGEVSRAAQIRMKIQADAEAYMIESYQREADKFADARAKEVEAMREAIRELNRQRIEALENAQKAAERQLEIELEAARKAMEARHLAIEQYLRDWMRITPETEEHFAKHLNNLMGFLEKFSISGSKFGADFSHNFGYEVVNGWTRAMNIAYTAIADAERWARLGHAHGKAYYDAQQRAMQGGSYRSPGSTPSDTVSTPVLDRRHFTDADIHVPTPPSNQPTSLPSVSKGMPKPGSVVYVPGVDNRSAIERFMNLPSMFHSGGYVRSKRARADEVFSKLQAGEYVMQKRAVQSIGVPTLNALNKIGSVGAVKTVNPAASQVNDIKIYVSGYNDSPEKLAEKIMRKIEQTKKDQGGRR